ncbi:MAG: anthranilate synthase component I family protein [Candidatus Binatia bacterium]
MPTQEVARAARLSTLLRRGAPRPHRLLLDGGAADGWALGGALYTDAPHATLAVFASGWARWQSAAGVRWHWGDPFALWQTFVDQARAAPGTAAGGVLTALAYDLKHAVERLPRRLPWPDTPLLFSAAYDWSYRAGADGAVVRAADARGLAAAVAFVETADEPPEPRRAAVVAHPQLARADYLAMVARAQAYIAAGDIYQVNLAQPFHAGLVPADAPGLYAAWVEGYPMPCAAYVDGGDWVAVSNSPECLLTVDGDAVTTRPIKGTRATAAAGELAGDAKERAEHVMIVDLERSDLGRVCATGSVAVAQFGAIRQYPGLAHMESDVRGRLRPGIDLAALLRATFPGGSITGAPKIRAMQIIEELEPAPRGFYTGAIGWTEPDGRSRFNIAIRTAVLDRAGLTYWAGGGIVADSQAGREYEETLLKSETLFRALRADHGSA